MHAPTITTAPPTIAPTIAPAPRATPPRPSGRALLRDGVLGTHLLRLAEMAAQDHRAANPQTNAATDPANRSGR